MRAVRTSPTARSCESITSGGVYPRCLPHGRGDRNENSGDKPHRSFLNSALALSGRPRFGFVVAVAVVVAGVAVGAAGAVVVAEAVGRLAVAAVARLGRFVGGIDH